MKVFVNDIWYKSYMNCGNEMKMKKWSGFFTQLHKLRSLRRSFLHIQWKYLLDGGTIINVCEKHAHTHTYTFKSFSKDQLLPPAVVMSQKTMKGSPETAGSIQYFPSPWASPLIRMSLQEEPGVEDVEPFLAKEIHKEINNNNNNNNDADDDDDEGLTVTEKSNITFSLILFKSVT